MKTACAAIAAFLFLLGPAAMAGEPAAELSGAVRVKDGDGLLFGKVEIRLQGIAAPEYRKDKRERGGLESLNSLRRLVEGKQVICKLDGTTASSNRPVGICYLNGMDIGAYQVVNGHARDCRRFSKGRYAELEMQAQSAGKNLSAVYPLPKYCKKE